MNAPISQLISIFDKLPDAQAGALLTRLAAENPFAAMKIIQRHFGFEDLVFADDRGLGLLFESVPESVLHAALSGGSETLLKRFADQLGTGRARTLIADVDSWDGPEASQDAARRTLLIKALMLHRKGKLIMTRPGID